MSGQKEQNETVPELPDQQQPHKVDEKVQEDAGRERAESGGYD